MKEISKWFFVWVCFTGAAIAGETQVAIDLTQGSSVSSFQQLESRFMAGYLPKQSALLGWYTGRCFFPIDQSIPRNGLLAGALVEGTENGGPLFPSNAVLKANLIEDPNRSSDYYDWLSKWDVKEINQILDVGYPKTQGAQEVDGSLSFTYDSKITLQFRQDKDYLYLRMMGPSEFVYRYCYFFSKVQ